MRQCELSRRVHRMPIPTTTSARSSSPCQLGRSSEANYWHVFARYVHRECVGSYADRTVPLQAVARSSLKSYAILSLSPDWVEISTLVRFELALSFDSRVQAQLYLPDLLHIITSISGAGDYAARQAVRQLTANVVHSLAKDPSSEVDVGKLRSILATLTSTEGGEDLFEVSGASSSRIGAWSHERLVALLVEVIEAAAPSIGMSHLPAPDACD